MITHLHGDYQRLQSIVEKECPYCGEKIATAQVSIQYLE